MYVEPGFRVFKIFYGAGEMAQWLSTLTALPEALGLIPSTHMAAQNCL